MIGLADRGAGRLASPSSRSSLPAAALGHGIVALAARGRVRAETFARAYGVERVVDSYTDLVADPEVDVRRRALAPAGPRIASAVPR